MSDQRPDIADWETDFDHQHPDYAANAPEIWKQLRGTCPIAHTDRYGGAWLPTRHADVAAIAKDTDAFSSVGVVVTEFRPDIPAPIGYAPPITSDPPFHAIARGILLRFFSPKAIDRWTPVVRRTCRGLIAEVRERLDAGEASIDIAEAYSRHIPVDVMADMLDLPREDGELFRGFIHDIMESAGEAKPYEESIDCYLDERIAERRENLGDDLISHLCEATVEGEPLIDEHAGRRVRHRPRAQPPFGVRAGHPSLRRLQPGPHGAAGSAGGVDGRLRRFRARRPGLCELVDRTDTGPSFASGPLPRSVGVRGSRCKPSMTSRSRNPLAGRARNAACSAHLA